MKLARLSYISTRSLGQIIYESLYKLLIEGFSGEEAKIAIQTGLSIATGKVSLDDQNIVKALAKTIQHYTRGNDISENEIKEAIIEALQMIFGPGGKLSNQVKFINKPTSDDVNKLYNAVLQHLQQTANR